MLQFPPCPAFFFPLRREHVAQCVLLFLSHYATFQSFKLGNGCPSISCKERRFGQMELHSGLLLPYAVHTVCEPLSFSHYTMLHVVVPAVLLDVFLSKHFNGTKLRWFFMFNTLERRDALKSRD